MQPLRLSAAAAAAVTLAGAGAAHAQAPAPTLAVDRECYSEGDRIGLTGAGFTPGGALDLLFGIDDRLATARTSAGPDGSVAAGIAAPDPARLLDDDAFSATVHLVANDRTRIDEDAQPPESQYAVARFTLSRWDIYYRSRSGRIVPGRPITWRAVGFTHAAGRTLYAHYRLRGRTVATERVGRLAGPCGDVDRRMARAFPFVPRRGRYTIVFNDVRGDASATPSIGYRVRVR